jgi:ketosteroid isomerase-like protein
MATLSARFVRALRALENELDLQPLVQLYADDCDVRNPLVDEPLLGAEGVRRYWRNYLDQFQDIRTEFTSAVDGQNGSALEWISSAVASDGRPLELNGSTVLLAKDERITSMHVYFDPRPLLALPQVHKEPTPIRASLDDTKTA